MCIIFKYFHIILKEHACLRGSSRDGIIEHEQENLTMSSSFHGTVTPQILSGPEVNPDPGEDTSFAWNWKPNKKIFWCWGCHLLKILLKRNISIRKENEFSSEKWAFRTHNKCRKGKKKESSLQNKNKRWKKVLSYWYRQKWSHEWKVAMRALGLTV